MTTTGRRTTQNRLTQGGTQRTDRGTRLSAGVEPRPPPEEFDDLEHLKVEMNRVLWGDRVKHASDEINRDKKWAATNAYYDEFNMYKDPNKMLATTLSLVVLMARNKQDIPKEYFLWGELYLRTIKDQWDEYPPNIAQLLGHLRYLRASKFEADVAATLQLAEEELEEAMVDDNVVAVNKEVRTRNAFSDPNPQQVNVPPPNPPPN